MNKKFKWKVIFCDAVALKLEHELNELQNNSNIEIFDIKFKNSVAYIIYKEYIDEGHKQKQFI